MSPTDEHAPVIIGQITGLHGINGGLKVYSYTRPRERIFNYQPWLLYLGGNWVEKSITSIQESGKKSKVVYLAGVIDRDAAGVLVDKEIAVYRHQLKPLPDGEFYWHDLLGLEVIDKQGNRLGTVIDMQETGANDVMVIQGSDRQLIPWVMGEVIQAVDLEGGTITIDWSEDYL